MSLLTEKQIAELACIASNQSTSKDLYEEFCEWNKKQTAQQFEPDWDNTPSSATKVYLDAVWFNSDMKEIDRLAICGWDRPTTSHPHAEIMMKYAEVAARRIDPWVEIELKSSNDKWVKIHQFSFDAHLEYRYIGETK